MATSISSPHVNGSPKKEAIKLSDVIPAKAQRSGLQESETLRRILSLRRGASILRGRTDENHPKTSTKSGTANVSPTPAPAPVWTREQLSKMRTEYYEEGFAYREPYNTVKDRIGRDSVIVTEIKLNCKLEEEQSFLSDISFYLSEIFQRPESCITVSLCTPEAMFFGGSSEPAYFMAVTALASQFAPTKNERSTALLQNFMMESLDISPRRGIIRYDPTPDEDLATNGMTARQEIEAIEHNSGEYRKALGTMSRNRSRRSHQSYPSRLKDRGKAFTSHITKQETSGSGEDRDTRSSETSGSATKRINRRKSLMAFFGR